MPDHPVKIRVGTASWSAAPEFVKAGWYPKGLAAGRRLTSYRQFFGLREVQLLLLRHTGSGDVQAGASSERQPPMYFRLGGGTLKGISKPGWIVWSRVYVVNEATLKFDTGLAEVVALPAAETADRWQQTTPQWPIMHVVLQGITRDQLMARHQANHIQVVYAPDKESARHGLFAKAAAMAELGLEVALCGTV